jgi:hypothetical protein
VLKQNSSSGKDWLGRVSKIGNSNPCRLIVVGAISVTWLAPLRHPNRCLGPVTHDAQTDGLLTFAIANKTAQTAWAMLTETGRPAGAVSAPYEASDEHDSRADPLSRRQHLFGQQP